MNNTRFAKAASFGTLMLAMIAHPLLAQIEPDSTSEPYAQITTAVSNTGSPDYANIPGLTITLPKATSSEKFATITLNMPNLYLSDGVFGETLGGSVAIADNGTVVAVGQVSTDVESGTSGTSTNGRKPITIVVKVALGSSPITVTAAWASSRPCLVNTDTFASLSASLTTN